MKQIRIIIVLLAVVLFSSSVSAQLLGQMAPASNLDAGASNIGSYLILAEHATGVVGSYRYGFSSDIEGRARLGFIDPDGGDMSVLVGADLKYLLWNARPAAQQSKDGYPFTFSLGTGFEYSKLGYAKYLGIYGAAIGSFPIRLQNGHSIEPYGRLSLRMQRVSVDSYNFGGQSFGGGSDTKLKIGANIGAEFHVIDLTSFTAEIQIDDDFAFMFGIELFSF
ncbi:MAG: hypothetical protein KAR42_16085 [candidate division Zixibacteria bacterium]|nr:hypothetical protein [candidate division Zixibacteria bacterium]